ncbi:MAG: GNAT family N-acetyltransferase [Casimicrobium sp.]
MTVKFNIRLANEADARDIAVMSRDTIEFELPWGWREIKVRHAIADGSTNVAVIREKEGLAGFGVMRYEDESAHLLLFAVSPKRRRQGVGSALWSWLEQVATSAGISHFRCEVRAENVGAIAFYKQRGFRPVSEVVGMYHGYVDGVRLEKGSPL